MARSGITGGTTLWVMSTPAWTRSLHRGLSCQAESISIKSVSCICDPDRQQGMDEASFEQIQTIIK
eukprot:4133075-Amphidinium_carterae.1